MRFFRSPLGLLAPAVLAAPAAAAAAPTVNLPPFSVTATGVSTPLASVPAGVTILTPKQWQAKGATTLAEALTGVPGLAVVQAGGDDQQTSVFVRGTDSEDVLVMQDGVPVNDPSDPNGAFNFGTESLTGIARIEVIRGPLSGLYGSNAIGGVINLITIKGSSSENGGKPTATVDLSGGFPTQGRLETSITGASGKFDYALAGSVQSESGYDETARRFTFYDGVKDPVRNFEGAINLGYALSDTTRLSLILRGRQDEYRTSSYTYGFDGGNERNKDVTAFGKLALESALDDGAVDLTLSAARVIDDRNYAIAPDSADPSGTYGDSSYAGTRTDLQARLVAHFSNSGPFSDSTLRLALTHDEDHADEKIDTSSYGYPYVSSTDATQETLAGAAGLQTTLFHQLTLSGTLRADSVSSFGTVGTYRAGATWAIPQTPFSLEASYGTGFLAPSLFDLYGIDNDGYVGNPALHPERSQGWDAGPAIRLPHDGSISLKAFANDVRDLIEYESTSAISSTEENIAGVTHLRGVEASATLNPYPWLGADLSYTYVNAIDLGLLRRPENTGYADLRIKPFPALTIEPQVSVTGRFLDYLYGNSGDYLGEGMAEPGTIVDLAVNYALSDRITLYATGRNLFESSFEPVNGLQTPPQTFLFGVRAKLGL